VGDDESMRRVLLLLSIAATLASGVLAHADPNNTDPKIDARIFSTR
jgi:hypothetical protein